MPNKPSPGSTANGDATASPKRTNLMIWLAAGILIALTWWHVHSLIDGSHQRELAAAERDLSNLTRLTEEHATRTLRSADQVIRFVQSRYLDLGDQINLQALTTSGVIDDQIFNQVGIIDAQGVYALSNLPLTKPLDLSDREHFKVHVASDKLGLFVSQPVLGRASGKWSIQMTRRVTRPNGDFGGVVVVSMDPAYFSGFYAALNLGAKGLTALYGLDGVARVRKVGSNEEYGVSARQSQMFERMNRGEMAGSFTHESVVDQVERMYFFRKVPQYELAVLTGLDVRDLLANHRRSRDALLLQAMLMTLLTLALAGAIVRHLSRIRSEMAARRMAQLVVEDRTEQLSAIFTMSPDGFVSFDHAHRVKYVSPAFAAMTSLGTVRLEGLHENEFSAWLSQLCSPASPFMGMAALRAEVSAGRPDAREIIRMSQDGHRVLQVGLRCSESESVSQILYFRDVTRELEVAQMKSDFLATAAHELRTPMQSILGFSEVLLETEVEAAEQREYLNIIHQESMQMARILDELLDLARIEARRGKDFRRTRVCLQELATELVRAFKPPPGRSPPELLMRSEALDVMADAGKLRQALLNVLSNAYKYSPAGGPVVLQIETTGDDMAGAAPRARIHITDQGIGMTPEQCSRVCERFYRADKSGKFPGTGLGMSIVKEICEMHGGELAISSTPGVGTRVSLVLTPAAPGLPQH